MLKKLTGTALLLVCLAGFAGAWSTSAYTSSSCRFPDAGQKLCYDGTSLIGCPSPGQSFYGQDANYSPALSQMSFTIYQPVSGKTVTVDNRTGLIWESTGSNSGNATASWAVALLVCEDSNFAGYSDWRLPNVRELMTLVDYGATVSPYINTTAFPSTQVAYYWSSTTHAMNPTYAWSVSFYDSLVGSDVKSTTINYVRCVRGGPQ